MNTSQPTPQDSRAQAKEELFKELTARFEDRIAGFEHQAKGGLKAAHLWGGAGLILALGVVAALVWLLVGNVAAAADHALTVGVKLAIETTLAVLASLLAVWLLALAVRDIPWIQRRVMPGADEMQRIESEFNALLDMYQDGKHKESVDVQLLASLARSLAMRNALTWLGVAVVFASMLFVMAPLA